MAYICPIAAALRWSARALNSLPQTENQPNSHYYWPSRQRADPGCSRSIESTATAKTGLAPKSACLCVRVVPLFDRLAPLLLPVPADYLRILNNGNRSASLGHRGILSDPSSFPPREPKSDFAQTDLINIHWNNNIWLQRQVGEPYDSEVKLFLWQKSSH